MSVAAKSVGIVLVGVLALTIFVPTLRQFVARTLNSPETVTVSPQTEMAAIGDEREPQELKIVTLLGFDAIPAILDPKFATFDTARLWMGEREQVLGLSINGENKAYSIPLLSRHEIVNDTVGGVPVAITW